MPAEDHKNMKKVQCWISQDTWDKIVSLGYASPTIAVTKAFEKLLEDPREDPHRIPLVSREDSPESPDIPVYQARIEGLEMVMQEKDRTIERLENDLKKADIDKEDLKATYNNYFLQMQLLISQKAITATTGPQKESKPAEKEEKDQTEKICKYCGEPFYTNNVQKEYCCKEHKDAAYNEKRRKERKEKEKEMIKKSCRNCLTHFMTEEPDQAFCSPACESAFNLKMEK